MKNTAEIDPFQTTDPWKDAVEQNKLRKEPGEESGNTEESKVQMITNEERTDEKKLRMTTKMIHLRTEAGSSNPTTR